jgi:drug/metabolite transporter (DMT)-like permease
MIRLMLFGLAAGLFFSTTFVLNRAMSLEGGHWYWAAALRYVYMVLLLGIGLAVVKGPAYLRRVLGEWRCHWPFWILSGSIGFGCFYALICFAAGFAPGWVVATTWQLTIIATLCVLMVNLSNAGAADLRSLLLGGLPVLIAAFCYPLGNQLVWEAQRGNRFLPPLDSALLGNSFTKVFLLSAGSLPFWLLLYPCTGAGLPSSGQLLNTGLVALFSGVIATTLFLHARGHATNASQLAAVDATQSSEVLFALAGEIVLLRADPPTAFGLIGIVITILGLIAFARHEHG